MKRFLVILFALLVCNVVSLCVTTDPPLSEHTREIVMHSETIVLQQSGSMGFVTPETHSVNLQTAKVNQTNHQAHTLVAHAGGSHSLNLAIAIRNSHVVGFSRSVDKYIYALRRIII